MADGTGIHWTNATINFVTGCSHAGSSGCDNCYAKLMTKRLQAIGQEKYRHGFDKVVCHDDPKLLSQFARWKRPRKIFVNSMSDTFHDDVPFEFIDKMYKSMLDAPQHLYQILTKRPENMLRYLSSVPFAVPPNIWHGVTVEDQRSADRRIPILLECPSPMRFLSCEPLLSGVYIGLGGVGQGGWHWTDSDSLPLVIVGGESGPNARPMHTEWVERIVKQCKDSGAKCFVKQMGTVWAKENNSQSRKGDIMEEWPVGIRIREEFDAS